MMSHNIWEFPVFSLLDSVVSWDFTTLEGLRYHVEVMASYWHHTQVSLTNLTNCSKYFRGKASSPANANSYDMHIIISTKVPDISPSLTDSVPLVHIVCTIRDQNYDVLVVRSICIAAGCVRQHLRAGEVQSVGDVSIRIRVRNTCDLNENYFLLNKRYIVF